MLYKAGDGRTFGNVMQGRAYDRSLMAEKGKADIAKAPGGEAHEMAVREHGIPKELHVTWEGPGHWRVQTKHNDGYEHISTHPEAFIAHKVAGTLLGADNPPVGVETHRRSRQSAPVGEKEDHRIAREDQRRLDGEVNYEDYGP